MNFHELLPLRPVLWPRQHPRLRDRRSSDVGNARTASGDPCIRPPGGHALQACHSKKRSSELRRRQKRLRSSGLTRRRAGGESESGKSLLSLPHRQGHWGLALPLLRRTRALALGPWDVARRSLGECWELGDRLKFARQPQKTQLPRTTAPRVTTTSRPHPKWSSLLNVARNTVNPRVRCGTRTGPGDVRGQKRAACLWGSGSSGSLTPSARTLGLTPSRPCKWSVRAPPKLSRLLRYIPAPLPFRLCLANFFRRRSFTFQVGGAGGRASGAQSALGGSPLGVQVGSCAPGFRVVRVSGWKAAGGSEAARQCPVFFPSPLLLAPPRSDLGAGQGMECPAAVEEILAFLCPRFWLGELEAQNAQIDVMCLRMVAHNRHVHQCMIMGSQVLHLLSASKRLRSVVGEGQVRQLMTFQSRLHTAFLAACFDQIRRDGTNYRFPAFALVALRAFVLTQRPGPARRTALLLRNLFVASRSGRHLSSIELLVLTDMPEDGPLELQASAEFH